LPALTIPVLLLLLPFPAEAQAHSEPHASVLSDSFSPISGNCILSGDSVFSLSNDVILCIDLQLKKWLSSPFYQIDARHNIPIISEKICRISTITEIHELLNKWMAPFSQNTGKSL
jgi:hypothetical protein